MKTESEPQQEKAKTGKPAINWPQLKESLPKTGWPVLEEVQNAYSSDAEDPARAVELTLRGKTASLRTQFETLKGGKK
jgi:hypothetical protein